MDYQLEMDYNLHNPGFFISLQEFPGNVLTKKPLPTIRWENERRKSLDLAGKNVALHSTTIEQNTIIVELNIYIYIIRTYYHYNNYYYIYHYVYRTENHYSVIPIHILYIHTYNYYYIYIYSMIYTYDIIVMHGIYYYYSYIRLDMIYSSITIIVIYHTT